MNQPDSPRSSRNVIYALIAIDATLTVIGVVLMLRNPAGMGLAIIIISGIMLFITGAGYLIMKGRGQF